MSRSPNAPSLLLLAALIVAGCAGPGPGPTGSQTPAGTASPSPAPSAVPSAAVGDSLRHADPALEALLPDRLGGVTLTRESQRGTDLTQQSAALETFLTSLGKTLEDFTLASAYSSSGDIEAEVGAWRINGADPARLMPGFIQAIQASSTTKLTVQDTTVEGRGVTQVGVPGQLTQGPLYAYVKGDTILFVQTTDPALAEQAMSLLP